MLRLGSGRAQRQVVCFGAAAPSLRVLLIYNVGDRLLIEYPWAGRAGMALVDAGAMRGAGGCVGGSGGAARTGIDKSLSLDDGVEVDGSLGEGWEWVDRGEERLYLAGWSADCRTPGAKPVGRAFAPGRGARAHLSDEDKEDAAALAAYNPARTRSSLQV